MPNFKQTSCLPKRSIRKRKSPSQSQESMQLDTLVNLAAESKRKSNDLTNNSSSQQKQLITSHEQGNIGSQHWEHIEGRGWVKFPPQLTSSSVNSLEQVESVDAVWNYCGGC